MSYFVTNPGLAGYLPTLDTPAVCTNVVFFEQYFSTQLKKPELRQMANSWIISTLGGIDMGYIWDLTRLSVTFRSTLDPHSRVVY